jgi:succinoglycan biosynthesis protein ExoA
MPKVSIIVPCFNEENTIIQLLDAINLQDFARQNVEVIIADGQSTDETRERIAQFQKSKPGLDLKIVDNPSRRIPVGLNLAIAASQGEIILRLDAHCVPRSDYVSRSVAALEDGLGWNVGGVWEIQPGNASWIAQSIAVAAAHPLGVGDALYRFTDKAQLVDTVPFGAFNQSLISEIGGFDETLQANEDYELNARIRKAGGLVWLDPAIRSIYYARESLGALARQYWRYGYWKVRMLRRYPETIRLRQGLPPIFVASLILLPLLSLRFPALSGVFLVEVVSYLAILLVTALFTTLKQKRMHIVVGLPLAIATMHVAWGAAFLFSALDPRTWRASGHANG